MTRGLKTHVHAIAIDEYKKDLTIMMQYVCVLSKHKCKENSSLFIHGYKNDTIVLLKQLFVIETIFSLSISKTQAQHIE